MKNYSYFAVCLALLFSVCFVSARELHDSASMNEYGYHDYESLFTRGYVEGMATPCSRILQDSREQYVNNVSSPFFYMLEGLIDPTPEMNEMKSNVVIAAGELYDYCAIHPNHLMARAMFEIVKKNPALFGGDALNNLRRDDESTASTSEDNNDERVETRRSPLGRGLQNENLPSSNQTKDEKIQIID